MFGPLLYGWKGRHPVITSLITEYKFSNANEFIDLFNRVIEHIVPTYQFEIRSIRELCNLDSGIGRISNKKEQNRLLRSLISKVPGERVPRHRLIRNLIEMGEFERADTEIRLFENDFGIDGPVHRYKIKLLIERALRAPGIMEEDRIAILERARDLSVIGIDRFVNNKAILRAYCDVGVEYYRLIGDHSIFDDAMEQMRAAEERIGDPDITRQISRYERLISGQEIRAKA